MSAPVVTVVTQPGCNPCLRVKRLLNEIREGGLPLEVREVTLTSEEGQALAIRHRILYPPAVLLEGRLVAKGKVYEHELRSALAGRTP